MKVLLIAHFFPPLRIAGAEKLALGFALDLLKKGQEVQVLCAGEWESGTDYWNGFVDETYQGIAVRRINFNWIKARDPNQALYDSLIVGEHLEQWLAEWKPDVVHVISLITLSASVVRVVKRHNIPIIFTLVDFWMICPKISLVRGDGALCDGRATGWDCMRCVLWNTKAYRGLRRVLPEPPTAALLTWASQNSWLSRQRGLRGMALDLDERRRVLQEIALLVDYVAAPSTNLGRVIDASGIFPQPVHIIHSGHDLGWLADMPAKQPVAEVRLGYIGQLIPIKGVDLLIRAFQATVGNGKAQLFIYGDATGNPSYAASLQSLAGQPRNIQFMGAFPHSRLGNVLAGLDVLVVPSQWHENNPRVIQEAFASKTPVIASNVGGIAEFIEHDVNGLLFQYNRVEDLCTQLKRVISEPDLIRRLQNGIKPVKTISEEMQEYLAIYQNLIDQQRESNP